MKTIVIGRLANNPSLLKTKDNKEMVADFMISNNTVKDGEEVTQFHRIIAKGNQAQLIFDHMRKGDLVCIDGRLTPKIYHDETCSIVTAEQDETAPLIAEKVVFLSSRRTQKEEVA